MEYGIPATKFMVAKTAEKAVKFAKEIGYPVVLKIVPSDVIHKFCIGGVILNLEDPEHVEQSFQPDS